MDKFKFTQEAKCEKSELDYGTPQVTNQINIFESYFKRVSICPLGRHIDCIQREEGASVHIPGDCGVV